MFANCPYRRHYAGRGGQDVTNLVSGAQRQRGGSRRTMSSPSASAPCWACRTPHRAPCPAQNHARGRAALTSSGSLWRSLLGCAVSQGQRDDRAQKVEVRQSSRSLRSAPVAPPRHQAGETRARGPNASNGTAHSRASTAAVELVEPAWQQPRVKRQRRGKRLRSHSGSRKRRLRRQVGSFESQFGDPRLQNAGGKRAAGTTAATAAPSNRPVEPPPPRCCQRADQSGFREQGVPLDSRETGRPRGRTMNAPPRRPTPPVWARCRRQALAHRGCPATAIADSPRSPRIGDNPALAVQTDDLAAQRRERDQVNEPNPAQDDRRAAQIGNHQKHHNSRSP